MKQYLLKAALGITAALVMSVSAHAATIWEPTDVTNTGDVNIIQVTSYLDLNGGQLALFADTDVAWANPLVLGSGGGIFLFTDNTDGSFTVDAYVANAWQGTLVINGSEFVLGVDWGNGYVGDSSATATIGDPTSFILDFTDGQNRGQSLAVDVSPVGIDPPEVPLPASAWLFGSALLGLVGIKRRKTKA